MDQQYKTDTVYIKSDITETSAITEVIQAFQNPTNKFVELTISIPTKSEAQFSKFSATIGTKKVVSKIFTKEKAQEKYTDSIAGGNVGVYSSYRSSGTYDVVIGNLGPSETIILTSEFLQILSSYDMSYEFSFIQKYPTFSIKNDKKQNIQNPNGLHKKIVGELNLKTKTKITRLIMINPNPKLTITKQINDDYLEAKITLKQEEVNKDSRGRQLFTTTSLVFRTEKITVPTLYAQYDPKKNETSYLLNFIYNSPSLKPIPIPDKPDLDDSVSYYSKYQSSEINDSPGLFIFVVDQSGSMRGKAIELVKSSLLLFIQSLPPRSFFQLIGFGSHFVKYNENPIEYTKENVENVIKKINELQADLGGTDIYSPLSYIFQEGIKDYEGIPFQKTIFLLTDGYVDDKDSCLYVIEKYSEKFRIHSLGIGNDFDKELIEKAGKLGKGSYSFIENIEEMNKIIIEALNKSLRPYLSNGIIEIKHDKLKNTNYIFPQKISYIYQDDIINYGFICEGQVESAPINFVFTAANVKEEINKEIKQNIAIDKVELITDGDLFAKIVMGNILKEESLPEEKIIELSKNYQILSTKTALFGEIESEQANTTGELEKLQFNVHYNKIMEKKPKKPGLPTNYGGHGGFRGGGVRGGGFRGIALGGMMPQMMLKRQCVGSTCGMPKSKKGGLISGISNFVSNKLFSKKEMPDTMIQEDNDMCIGMDCEGMTQPSSSLKAPSFSFNDVMLSQDIILGYWDKNDKTNSVLQRNDIKNIYQKIRAYIENDEQLKEKEKILTTITILYYIFEVEKDKVPEVKLIINKAKKFLSSYNLNYDLVISKIK